MKPHAHLTLTLVIPIKKDERLKLYKRFGFKLIEFGAWLVRAEVSKEIGRWENRK